MQRLAEEAKTAADSTGLVVESPPTPSTGTVDPTANSDTPTNDDAAAHTDDQELPPLGAGVLFVLGLLWLAATMWSARASFNGDAEDPTVVVSSAALVLPGVVVATLMAGAAAGLAGASRFARPGRTPARTNLGRVLVGAAGGAGVGIVAAAVTLIAFGFNSAIGVIAATIGVSALLAGTTAGLPATPLAAGIAANLGVFISGALLNLFQTPLKSLLGAGKTVASQSAAADRFLHLGAFIGGLVAAIVAYLYLHRRETGRAWHWYLLAGALPGLLYLVGEVFTRLGGTSLFSVVGGFSDDDQAVLDYLSGARVITGLIITFTGGIFAMILVGRTLRRPEEPEPAMTTDPEDDDPVSFD
jgi:iron complex transport system permease protein